MQMVNTERHPSRVKCKNIAWQAGMCLCGCRGLAAGIRSHLLFSISVRGLVIVETQTSLSTLLTSLRSCLRLVGPACHISFSPSCSLHSLSRALSDRCRNESLHAEYWGAVLSDGLTDHRKVPQGSALRSNYPLTQGKSCSTLQWRPFLLIPLLGSAVHSQTF